MQGDRVGICVTQLDAALVERGVACTPGALPTFTGAIAAVDKIRFFVGQMPSRLKVHITVGHQTVMGEIQFFGLPDGAEGQSSDGLESIISRINSLTTKVDISAMKSMRWVLVVLYNDMEAHVAAVVHGAEVPVA